MWHIPFRNIWRNESWIAGAVDGAGDGSGATGGRKQEYVGGKIGTTKARTAALSIWIRQRFAKFL